MKRLGKSFYHAFQGLKTLWAEPNFRIHILATIAVVLICILLEVEKTDLAIIIICCGAVLSAEAFNTAIEKLCDHLHPERHENIKKVKDVSAAAVMIAASVAVVVGVIILLPYVL